MEENDINDFNEEDEDQMYVLQKLLDTMMVFNSHFAKYVRESDEDLFKKAVDYAKTFTEEDVPGIMLHYFEEDVDDDKKEQD